MLVNTKARVGVFSIALGAYLPQFPSVVPEFESQYAAFKKTLPDTVEVIDGGDSERLQCLIMDISPDADLRYLLQHASGNP